jgi:hypothetical protein
VRQLTRASLIGQQVIPYWTSGATCCPGVSTPKIRCLAEKEREWAGRGKKSEPEVGWSQGKRNWDKQVVLGLHTGKEKK